MERQDTEWERKLAALQKEKMALQKEKDALLHELRVQLAGIEQTERHLEDVSRRLNDCSIKANQALEEALLDLVPEGNLEDRRLAVYGWMEIKRIMTDDSIEHEEAFRRCKEAYNLWVKPKTSYQKDVLSKSETISALSLGNVN